MLQADTASCKNMKLKRRRDPDTVTAKSNEVGSINNPYTVAAFTQFQNGGPLNPNFFEENVVGFLPHVQSKAGFRNKPVAPSVPHVEFESKPAFPPSVPHVEFESKSGFAPSAPDVHAEAERNTLFSFRTEKKFLQNQVHMLYEKSETCSRGRFSGDTAFTRKVTRVCRSKIVFGRSLDFPETVQKFDG